MTHIPIFKKAKADPPPVNGIARILAFVRANPLCTTREVYTELAMPLAYVAMTLTRLKNRQEIDSCRLPDETHLHWQLTNAEEDEEDDMPADPIRAISTAWVPHHQRDPLHVAFYGPARTTA